MAFRAIVCASGVGVAMMSGGAMTVICGVGIVVGFLVGTAATAGACLRAHPVIESASAAK